MQKYLTQKNTLGFTRTLKLVSGFTLVETMVALSVFTLAILSFFAVLGNGVRDTNYAKNKITATYLAEEGIELTRNMRDTFVFYSNVAPTTGWTDFKDKFITNGCATVLGCYLDYTKDQNESSYNMFLPGSEPRPVANILVKACTGVAPQNYTSCEELKYQTSGVYSYTGNPSGFRRKITVEEVSDNELKVVSTVYWTKGSAVYSVAFSDNLFNLE